MSDSLSIAGALSLPSSRVGDALLRIAEDQWFDRKSSRVQPKTLATTIAAFANAEGGTIVIGLADGRVEGVGEDTRRLNAWRQSGFDFCEPPVNVRWREVECVGVRGKTDRLLVGDIAPSSVVHTTSGDDAYLRVGDENRKLTFAQRQELQYDKGQASFDGTLVTRSLDGLDENQVLTYSKAIGSPDQRRALEARGLVLEGRLTAAAWLLFAPLPQAEFPSAYVRVIRYQGLTRETGSRQGIVNDVRCEGPIPRVLDQTREAVDRLEPHRRVLGAVGRFVLEGLIPQDAWMEGIVNAVVHRSYSLGGDHIRVEIFDDRIEVESPGRFPGLIRPRDFPNKVTRFARNPRIARACAELRFGQELGEGIRRMYEEMRLRGLSEPFYTETQASVRLVLSSLVVGGEVVGQLNPQLLRLIDIVRQGHNLSTGEIAEAAESSRPAAIRRLRRLEALGYLEWVGKSPSDPRAFWRLKLA